MFRTNNRNQEPLLLSDVSELPERSQQRLKESWAGTFREEVFGRIEEERFAVLYSEKASRPNYPVNILLGLEILKDGRGWTDEEMYEHFCYDLQVRYALGCDRFREDEFELRTLYNFRHRLAEYTMKTGEDLLKGLFEQITDEQMAKLGLKTDKQRYDSTMLLSNIADLSRLELLIVVIQRLWRVVRKEDQSRWEELFGPYVKESAGQYSYRLKGREVVWAHIAQVGQALYKILEEMRTDYKQDAIYEVAQRFFEENFVIEQSISQAKDNREIQPGCLQSVDDLEATYRVKGNHAYKGYVANLAETCHPDNPVQLFDDLQVAPNQVSDIQMLLEGVPDLQERTGMDTVVTDGAYVSPAVDATLRTLGIEQIPTALTGTLPDHRDGRLALSDFDFQQNVQGEVTGVTCPTGQSAQVQAVASGKSYRLIFDPAVCRDCPFFCTDRCPVEPNKDLSRFSLYLPKDRANSAQRRRHFEQHKQEARNLRTAVEAGVFQFKHNWIHGKLRVRGLIRVSATCVFSLLHVNLRRIDRYRHGKLRDKRSMEARKAAKMAATPA